MLTNLPVPYDLEGALSVIVKTDGWFAAVTMVGGCCAGLGGQMLTISGAGVAMCSLLPNCCARACGGN